MILTVREAVERGIVGENELELSARLTAVESAVRAYTHNHFQNRFVRFAAESQDSRLTAKAPSPALPYFQVGDTVEITQSKVNDGLYVVTCTGDGYLKVDGVLFPAKHNLVTKVVYPEDVKAGALNLLRWEMENRDKVGVKSETISRHSVTYYDQDAGNTAMGYPISLMGFLTPYRKARF